MAYRNYAPANGFIVDGTGNGDFSTISAAVSAATSGKTIFVKPGTYVLSGSVALAAGVNICAWECDPFTPNVTIQAASNTDAFTASFAGSMSFSGINFQTNGTGKILTVSGSSATIININKSNFNCSSATGISFTSSSSSAKINCYDVTGNIGTTGIALYSSSSAGQMLFQGYNFTNTGASTTAASNSAGAVSFYYGKALFPVSTTSTGGLVARFVRHDTSATNTTTFTINGTGSVPNDGTNSGITNADIISGTASSISVGAGATCALLRASVESSNTNAITGAGTITYLDLIFTGSSKLINTTTQTVAGTLQGSVNTAPTGGCLGEQVRSAVTSSACTNATPKNLTSISLTAGIWDVSINSYCIFSGNCTAYKIGISATSATFLAADGDSQNITGAVSGANVSFGLSVPSYRVSLTTTTTYYLVAQANFTTGTANADGRISATRVG